jgi:glucose/arabinose dehydrogenase
MESSKSTATDFPSDQMATALATVPSGFQEVTLTSDLASPTSMDIAPDGRVFICEQRGTVRIVKNGVLLSTPFVTLDSTQVDGERGLDGITLDPDFPSTPYVYLYYTYTSSPIHNRLTRYTVSGGNADVADPASEKVLLDLDNLSTATNHNGGAIHFGPDGMLYVAVGENANGANSQSLTTILGKMLRINKDGTIPSDNPYAAQTTGKNKAIWAMGLRNPFSFAFQPGTGRMFINDVGQSSWEEIDDGVAKANYGWPTEEGKTGNASFVDPYYTYVHSGGDCAIVGAAFYNPVTSQFPSDYQGDYFFGDYCTGWINRIDPSTKQVSSFITGVAGPIDVKVDKDGAFYYLAINSGALAKVTYTSSQAPTISMQPTDVTVTAGKPAHFTVSANGAGLTYKWQRNQVDIPGATASSYTLDTTTLADNGAKFRCVAGNSNGDATSNEALLTVVSNHAPSAAIANPALNTTYSGGQQISYSGTGTDPEDGTLAASAFTWVIVFHHDAHTHPFLGPITGVKSGSFAIPTQGETSSNVWYRIHLYVQDSQGMKDSAVRDILPVKTSVTLATNPLGFQLQLDGQPVTTPYTFTGVAGIQRNISAPAPQSSGGKNWNFLSWSDAGAAGHDIVTPGATTTFTASFQEAPVAPSITQQSGNITVTAGRSALFTVTAGGTAPLSYKWQRNKADIPGATADSYTLSPAQIGDDGAKFRCVVSNSAGSDTSVEAMLSIAANNSPLAKITAPAAGSVYSGGQLISYSGTAVDTEDGTLPAAAFIWEITFHHDGLISPFMAPTAGSKSGTFTVPASGETSSNVFYRIHLKAKDSQGVYDSTFADILPVKTAVTLTSNPVGLQVLLDGNAVKTPFVFTGVAGMKRTLGAPTPQAIGSRSLAFSYWSDAGALSHVITTPASAATITANFQDAATGIYNPGPALQARP